MPLSQLNAEHADPVGLATAMAAAAMEHTAAASLASMHAWTWASAAVKAQMNYAASSSPWQDQGGSQYRADETLCTVPTGRAAHKATPVSANGLQGTSAPNIFNSSRGLVATVQAEERSTASSLADTGGSVGGLLALGGGPFLASLLGWQLTFAVYGVLSSCFCITWFGIASSLPTSSSFISEIELQMLINEGVVNKSLASQSQPTKVQGISWRMFFSSPVLAVCYAHAVFNFGRYFIYGWISTFYSQVLGVPAATAAFCITALQVADAFVKLAVAPFADRLVKSGRLSILGLRRLLSCSGFVGFGAALGLCSLTTSPVLVTAALVLGKSAAACHAAGFKTNYLNWRTLAELTPDPSLEYCDPGQRLELYVSHLLSCESVRSRCLRHLFFSTESGLGACAEEGRIRLAGLGLKNECLGSAMRRNGLYKYIPSRCSQQSATGLQEDCVTLCIDEAGAKAAHNSMQQFSGTKLRALIMCNALQCCVRWTRWLQR
eukprot:s4314_g8.t1